MLDRVLLELCRPLMILAAFFTKKPSLMGEHEWKVSTQLQDPDARPLLAQTSSAVSDLSFLMEILAVLPKLFLQCTECIRLAKTRRSPQACVPMLWSRITQLQQELQDWKAKWDRSHQSEIYEIAHITLIDPAEVITWTTVFHFNSVELANTFTMYHAVIILLTGIPKSLIKAGLGPPKSTCEPSNCDGVGVNPSIPSVVTSLQNICRSLGYYLLVVYPSQSPADFYLFFPMHIARRTSNQLGYCPEHAWLANAFKEMKSRFPTGLWANMDFANKFSGSQEGLFD